ncbi:hypothetical protein Tco_0964041 [Tanacetum coccineum]
MSTKRRLKRKIKIPLKFRDTVYDLMGRKNKYENSEKSNERGEIRGNVGDVCNGGNGDSGVDGSKELDVMEMSDKLYIAEEVNCYNQKSSNDKLESNKQNEEVVKKKSFVTTICENIVDNKLKLIPTRINDGREVVMFNDEILQEGLKKWWEGGILSNTVPIKDMPNADNNAKLCDMISNGEWKWPEIWINNYP